MMKITLDLIPLKGVGPFKFGSTINEYSHLNLEEINDEHNEKVNWRVFKLPDIDLRVYFDNNMLTSIACYEACFFKDHNLMGMPFDKFKIFLKKEPDGQSSIEMSSSVQDIYDFDDMALQVWVENNKVVTIFCSSPYEE